MSYGLKVRDTSGNTSLLTVKIGKILSAGRLTMSNTLEGDGTYGEDIALGSTIARAKIGVLAYPVTFTFKATVMSLGWSDGSYPFSWYASDSYTYYTKNTTTGVMSTWTAGSMTQNTAASFDGMASAYPLCSWDYLDSETTFTHVRIWAAMAHLVYDASAADFKAVYTIGNQGIETVDYMVFIKG